MKLVRIAIILITILSIAQPVFAQGEGNPITDLARTIVRGLGLAAAAIFAIGVAFSGGIEGQIEAHFGRPGALAMLFLRIASGIAAFLIGVFALVILEWLVNAVSKYNLDRPIRSPF
ncbi:MAG: hypothetical protein QXH03_00205 [Candidatus Bathyarchaeia archaeon]